jgi:hypothetical protein
VEGKKEGQVHPHHKYTMGLSLAGFGEKYDVLKKVNSISITKNWHKSN